MNQNQKAVWGWAMYDWANSAFATTVMAGFFPIFFKTYWSHGTDVTVSTAQLGIGNSIAGLFVALLAPILGAVADQRSARKKFLMGFAYMGVLMTAGLFLVGKGQWVWAVFVYVLGVVGFAGANIFYDSLLPSIAGEKRVDYVSGLGFAMGYLGGGILFLFNVLMATIPERFGLADAAQGIRYSFVSVALWWGGFTLFVLFWVPESGARRSPARGMHHAAVEGFRRVFRTLKTVRRFRTASLFLIAYWFYIDGVDTIIRMAVDYGLSLGFDTRDLILSLLMVQFIGFPAALGFGKLAQYWGVRKGIYLALLAYMGITLWGSFMTTRIEFYILAGAIGLVQGGIQALSRSYFSRFVPPGHSAEFYGFYNMLGKFAAILGPALMGLVGLLSRRLLMPPDPYPEALLGVGRLASRLGIASLLILFIVGTILFHFVDEEQGKREAAAFNPRG